MSHEPPARMPGLCVCGGQFEVEFARSERGLVTAYHPVFNEPRCGRCQRPKGADEGPSLHRKVADAQQACNHEWIERRGVGTTAVLVKRCRFCSAVRYPAQEPFQLVEENALPYRGNALSEQIGGDHYKAQAIQPVQFAMQNWWDFCAASILKYLSRHRKKNGLQDLQKARHFVELRAQQLLTNDNPEVRAVITMDDYLEKNNITGNDRLALIELDAWVYGESDRSKLQLLVAIDLLIGQYVD